MKSHFLGIGDVVFGQGPTSIMTVLGSCVAITMYSPSQRLGAICHAALPQCHDQQCKADDCKPGKHVECAVQVMLKQFTKQGVPLQDIQVKLFGGAKMFSHQIPASLAIGSMNDQAARRIIQRAGLAIQAVDTGGTRKRKLTFDMGTGKVVVEKPKPVLPHKRKSSKRPRTVAPFDNGP